MKCREGFVAVLIRIKCPKPFLEKYASVISLNKSLATVPTADALDLYINTFIITHIHQFKTVFN